MTDVTQQSRIYDGKYKQLNPIIRKQIYSD